MSELFPKRRKTDVTAEKGVNRVSTIINDHFGWIFRRTHQEHDYGVDGHIDYVAENGSVTGQSIAVQIKTGKSYLSENGSMHWYIDSKEHLNYFLNLSTPIILIICDPETSECYWAHLEKNKIDYRDVNWRHPIPKQQKLNKSSLASIIALFGEIKDHVSDFEEDNKFLSMLNDNSFIMYKIPKTDIKKCNTANLQSFLERITRNEKMTLAVQGKLYISTYGYENDTREVHQIKEIKQWAKKAREKINQWYLCTSESPRLSTLLWVSTCTCGGISVKIDTTGHHVECDAKKLLAFLNECFDGLNEDSDKWGWDEEYNYNISKRIHQELFPYIPFPDLKDRPKS